jgi:signal transduction histidine kinase/CheY-like chemotaxis protein
MNLKMSKKGASFFFIVTLALILIALIVVTQVFTTTSTTALTTGNRKAVETFRLNNKIQELVNLSFDLESKLKKNEPLNEARLQSVNDSLLLLGYNASILSAATIVEGRSTSEAINSIVDTQVYISEQIIAAVRNANSAQLAYFRDSLRVLAPGDKVYKNCLQLQEALNNNLQQALYKNSEQAGKLSLLNRILALFSIIAILALATIIIRRQSQQLKLIEELKEAELAALKSKNAKEEFLANMSHELRTPLNALIGFGNLLDKTALNDQQKEYVEIIKSSGYNLLYIVNDVLDISKIEAGKLTIAHRPFNLYNLLSNLQKMFSASVQEKGLFYKYSINEQVPEYVIGDPDRLQQIFVNLISNAIKFTAQGGIEVSTGIIWIDEEAKYYKLSFTIKDSGIGIPKDKVETIFERFEQLEHGALRQHGGTGLGLTIVKNLVERMGGSISVYSHVNEGSEFNFTCILEKSDAIKPEPEKATDASFSLKNYKVLVVEDNKANQVLLKHIFNKHNVQPRIIDNGKEAVAVLRKESFDIVLMDIQMPVMDGYTAISILRNELYLKTPVIAMTAYVSESDVRKCLESGFTDYMAKPVDEQLLIQKIASTLNHTENKAVHINNSPNGSSLDFLREIVGDDSEVLTEILQEMNLQWHKDKNDLLAASAQQDKDGVKRILHRMKSTFSSLGPEHQVYKILMEKGHAIVNGNEILTDETIKFIEEMDGLINSTLHYGIER